MLQAHNTRLERAFQERDISFEEQLSKKADWTVICCTTLPTC